MRKEQKKTAPDGQSIGASRGGPTTKIHLVCDARGLPLHFHLSGGNLHDALMASHLIDEIPRLGKFTIADKGYDSDAIREKIRREGSRPVIPYKSNRIQPGKLNRKIYRHRHQVENVFCSLKQFRSFATRYEKLALHYAGVVALACIMIWLRN